MDAGINNVIYMELHSGPKMANSTCGKTIVAGTIDPGSTVMCLTVDKTSILMDMLDREVHTISEIF